MRTKGYYINVLSGPVPLSTVLRESQIEQCLTEYAKEQAIAFANFIAFRHKPHDIDTWDEGKKNTTEIYYEFIDTQSSHQQ